MVLGKKTTFRSRRREVRLYRKHLFVSGSIAFCVFLLGVGIWYGARRPEVTVNAIAVEGGVTVSHDIVRSKVESVLAGTYALLIPRHFSYALPERQIASAVNSIPRVHNASVVRTSRNELAVSFDEYMPYALWCDSLTEDASATPACIFVDENGYAYADAPPLFGETLVRFVTEEKKPEIGEHVFDSETIAHYRAFADAIATYHESRLRAITETKDNDLILRLSDNVDLLITKDADIQNVFENIESVLQADGFKGKPLSTFEYIDLRFGNKIYVKEHGADEELAKEEADGVMATTTQNMILRPVVSTTTPR